MAQGYKHEEMTLAELCQHIYEAFGAYAVINLVDDRKREGYLSDVTWKDCDGCDYRSPFDTDGSCLICGSCSCQGCQDTRNVAPAGYCDNGIGVM